MKLRMRTLSAGPKGVRAPGQVIEVSDAEGEQLLKGGYAERLEAPAPRKPAADVKTETASTAPPENAAGAGGKKPAAGAGGKKPADDAKPSKGE